MAQIDVDGTAVELPIQGGRRPAVWNNGPGKLYLARSEDACTEAEGWPIASGAGYEFLDDLSNPLWAVSDDTSDVRIMAVD